MINVGDTIPAFNLVNQNNQVVTQDDLFGQSCVLYFYPRDLTPGCTTESCDFRDLMPNFNELEVRIFGISKDSAASHQKFIAKHQLNFDLLVDAETQFAQDCGVWVEKSMYGRKYMGMDRATFLIDESGIVRQIWRKVKVKGHAQAVYEAVQAIKANLTEAR